jgi:hypothetical protein
VDLPVLSLESEELIIGIDLFEELGFSIVGIPSSWPEKQAYEKMEMVNTTKKYEHVVELVQDQWIPKGWVKPKGRRNCPLMVALKTDVVDGGMKTNVLCCWNENECVL